MADVYKGLTVEFGGEVTKLQKALKGVNATSRDVQSQLTRVNRQLKFNPNSTVLLAQKQELLGRQIAANREKLTQLRAANQQYAAKAGSLTQAERDGWAEVQRQIIATEGVIKGYQTQFLNTGAAIAANNSVLGRAGNYLVQIGDAAARAGERLSAFGGVMTRGVTLPMGLAAGASVKAAVDIDTSLTNVRKTVNGTEEDYQALKKSAIEFSKTNAVSASQILDVEALGAQLGFTLDVMANGKSEIQEFGEIVSGLDIATDMDVETAGTNLAQFANITRMAKDEASNYGSAIVDLGNHLATTESRISDMSMRTAAAGTQVGMSQSQILGWSAAMSSMGIEAEAGGTAFSQFISKIDAAVATGGEKLDAYAKVAGMSADSFAASWKESSSETVLALLKGLSASENMTVALNDIGVEGIRQSDVLKRLAGNTDLVASAVDIANRGWEENTALSNEVANRNSSLAAQFEMLKNRIIAIADDVGEPVAKALLGVVDAAEPLFGAIASGARAFAEMDTDEQRVVLTTLALVAAIGPASSLLGGFLQKVGSIGEGMKNLAKWLAKVDARVTGTAKAIDELGESGAHAADGTTKAATALSALRGALAIAGITALVAAIGYIASAFVEAKSKADAYNNSIDSMASASASLNAPLSDQAASLAATSSAFATYKGGVDEAVKAHQDLADKMRDNFSETNANAGLLQTYATKMQELAGNCAGSSERMSELRTAVDGYNKVAGTSYTIIDETSGALSVSSDAVKRNTDAWIANARAKAGQELLDETIKERIKLEGQLAEQQEKREKAVERQNAVSRTGKFISSDMAPSTEIAGIDEEIGRLNGLLDSNSEAQDRLTASINESYSAAEAATRAMGDYAGSLADATGNGDAFAELAARLGTSTDDLSQALSAAGISAAQLASVGADSFAMLYTAAGGDLDKVRESLDKLDKMRLDPKSLHVTDEGTIADEAGRVWDLDAQTIDGKHFTVDDAGTISIEGTNVDHLDAKRIADKSFVITDGGTADTAAAEADGVTASVNRIPSNPGFTVSANAAPALSELDRLSNRLGYLTANAWKVAVNAVTSGAYADGGVARGTVIKAVAHAQGGINGIVTRPTLTNVGLVGEAGREAVFGNTILPLDNRAATLPLARTIAEQIEQPRIDYDELGAAVARSMRREMVGMGVYMDGRATVGALVDRMDEALGSMQRKGGF